MKIYHYTSTEGFYGIVNNNYIRMSLSEYMNDPTDSSVFGDIVTAYLESNDAVYEKGLHALDEYEIEKPKKIRPEVDTMYQGGCDFPHYVVYVLQHVPIYIMSCTTEHDEMGMWNYYGRGGMELKFDEETFISLLEKTLDSENEYLISSPVIYVNKDTKDLTDFPEIDFSKVRLVNRNSLDLCGDDQKSMDVSEKGKDYLTKLYTNKSLSYFIELCVKDFLFSLRYLLDNEIIQSSNKTEDIFRKVLRNSRSLNRKMVWKRDLLLYLVVLSALLKSSDFDYEKEHRIAYIRLEGEDLDTNSSDRSKENYFVKTVKPSVVICPCANLYVENLCNAIEEVVLSPITPSLPIDIEKYRVRLEEFLHKHNSGGGTVWLSSHDVKRW